MNRIVPDRIGVFEATHGMPHGTPGQAGPAAGERPSTACRDLRQAIGQPGLSRHLRPLHDRVLVRRSHEQTCSGLVIIPHVAREKSLRGVVVAVGPGKKDADGVFRETMVRPGDVVIFSASVNVPYPDLVGDGDLVMMAEADILGIVEEASSR